MKVITVDQVGADHVTHLARQYWSPDTRESHLPYDSQIIEDIYETEIKRTNFDTRRIIILELSQYLENYVWPNYSKDSTTSHLITVVILINEKLRERVPAWESFEKRNAEFPTFLQHLMMSCLDQTSKLSLKEQTQMIIFLNHMYSSIECDLIRKEISFTVSYNILECVSPGQLINIFKKFPNWAKTLKRTERYRKKLSAENLQKFNFDTNFLYSLVKLFLKKLSLINTTDMKQCKDLISYCERFLELMIALESQLPTRRYFNTIITSLNLLVKCNQSALANTEDGNLFSQLLYVLNIYSQFEIDENSGHPLTDLEVTKEHYNRVRELQKVVFRNFSDMHEFSFFNVASVDSEENLRKYMGQLPVSSLLKTCNVLNLLCDEDKDNANKGFLLEVVIWNYKRRSSQHEAINKMPLYPTEDIIWNDNVIPSEYFTGDVCLALPKLNLQFLTLHDYLLRNFDLFRLESTYEIRQDIEDVITRLNPWVTEDNHILFRGWARMAQPITKFAICEVAKPNIGEDKPSRVRADVSVNLNVRRDIKDEWQALRKHDVCLLLSIIKPSNNTAVDINSFPKQYGIKHVRGCEIEGMLDANGRVIEEGPEPKPIMKGDDRTYRVWLDCNQYKCDMDMISSKECDDIYQTFNVLMRRRPKENNFKAVLETIRDLMNTECVVPEWLLDIILGYGDPGAANYSNMDNSLIVLDFNDTFLDMQHLVRSFPTYSIINKKALQPPYVLTFNDSNSQKRQLGDFTKEVNKTITVESYEIPNRGPYTYTTPRKNVVMFTPTQVEAIRSGMQPGLTMVVGPPGTGKTDVAVQIISNIYHNNPQERTLVVTHSNQALNQLFEKVIALDVDERHLLRLGHGEEALETEKDFSRYGRVNYVLNKRLELLEEVTRLKDSLGVAGAMGASCETAGYFFLHHILSRWEKFMTQVHIESEKPVNVKDIKEHFPFHVFFSNAPQPLFKENSYEEDMEIARGCFCYLENIFAQLKEFRAFEMLRSGLDRTRYLLIKEAKIIAMTCTHAALKRQELVAFGFQFDNILMEESAQILEIETFIPLLLQNPEDGRNRLKRWVMIGDHHQLPPVIKNMAFQKFSNMEQSLFTRFVRLGVPTIELDAQGRARPSICSLYNWRYKNLGNLPHVLNMPEYIVGNPGFYFDYQLINVEELNGRGESEPRRFFYQNLAEAEYIVHLFMYMRLLGYPASAISLLTTYNGQKELIKDVVEQRCARNPIFGRPHKISTVDKYQGQQNDYILLSLVRTKTVGHLRDVRRLIVALSRARLGLYVFGKVSLFKNCFELQQAFDKLTNRPLQLQVAPWERYPTNRSCNQFPDGKPVVITDVVHMSSLVHQLYGEMCTNYMTMQSEKKNLDQVQPGHLKMNKVAEVDNTGAKYDSDEEENVMIVNEVENADGSKKE